jgi:hypothetical protein
LQRVCPDESASLSRPLLGRWSAHRLVEMWMRLRRNTFAAATWSEESEILRRFAAAADAVMVAAQGRDFTGNRVIAEFVRK